MIGDTFINILKNMKVVKIMIVVQKLTLSISIKMILGIYYLSTKNVYKEK
jgi:hypothetical protein